MCVCHWGNRWCGRDLEVLSLFVLEDFGVPSPYSVDEALEDQEVRTKEQCYLLARRSEVVCESRC